MRSKVKGLILLWCFRPTLEYAKEVHSQEVLALQRLKLIGKDRARRFREITLPHTDSLLVPQNSCENVTYKKIKKNHSREHRMMLCFEKHRCPSLHTRHHQLRV